MNARVACALLALGSAAALTLSSSDAHAEKRGTLGLGVSTDASALLLAPLPVSMGNVHVPIQITDSFRIEPEFGLLSTSSDDGDDNTESNLNLRLGVGLLFTHAMTKDTNVYGGARLGVIFNTREEDNGNNTVTTSRTGFVGGGVSGGEYFFSPAFSVGGEFQLNVISLGDETIEADGVEDSTEESDLIISTNTLVMVRWYFQ